MLMGTRRRLGALTVSVLGLAGGGTLWAASASAHVTVAAPGVTAGASDASITFRVPDESASASTVGLTLHLPTDHPIAGVLVAPQPGWTATIKQTKLTTPVKTDDGEITEVVSEIDWKAGRGAGIGPGFFGQFTVIAGKLPDGVSSLTFKAIQTYSDGTVVSWIEESAPGSNTVPEHPAPSLDLAAATNPAGTTAGPSASAAPSVTATPAASSTAASKGAATTGIVLGAIGVLLGAAALFVSITRARRSSRV
jgi:uncharacterized protein